MTNISRVEYAERLVEALIEQYEDEVGHDAYYGELHAIEFCAELFTSALYDVDEELEDMEDMLDPCPNEYTDEIDEEDDMASTKCWALSTWIYPHRAILRLYGISPKRRGRLKITPSI